VYIPGFFNRTLTFFGKLLPREWVAAAIYRRWSKAQKQWIGGKAFRTRLLADVPRHRKLPLLKIRRSRKIRDRRSSCQKNPGLLRAVPLTR
jgi:hypothetical protein